jgi:hypothetical protein
MKEPAQRRLAQTTMQTTSGRAAIGGSLKTIVTLGSSIDEHGNRQEIWEGVVCKSKRAIGLGGWEPRQVVGTAPQMALRLPSVQRATASFATSRGWMSNSKPPESGAGLTPLPGLLTVFGSRFGVAARQAHRIVGCQGKGGL